MTKQEILNIEQLLFSGDLSSILLGLEIGMILNYNFTKFIDAYNKRPEIPFEENVRNKIISVLSRKMITFHSNRIDEIPDYIYLMKGLERVDVSYNHVGHLSSKIFTELPKLKHLDIEHNNIIYIPENILNCDTLERVDCGGNVFENESIDILLKLREKGVNVIYW